MNETFDDTASRFLLNCFQFFSAILFVSFFIKSIKHSFPCIKVCQARV